MATTSPTRGSGFWLTIVLVTLIVLAGIWWFATSDDAADGVGRDLDPAVSEPLASEPAPGNPEPTVSAPPPTPNSPAATGEVGEPSGTAGAAPKPGDPTAAATTD